MSTFTFVVLHKDNTNEKHDVEIYLDDTIENIKTKLSDKLSVKNIQQYYLFYKTNITYNPYDVYHQLSLNGTRTITSTIFEIWCLNNGLNLLEKDKTFYELDDFLKLDIKEMETTISIGISRNTTYVVNPFQNTHNQLEDSSTTSKELLMKYNNIEGKDIYVCLAEEVLEYCLENKLENKQVINVYYPYLFQKNKFEISMLTPEDSSIKKYKEYNDMIDFIYTKYNADLKPKQGISDIYFVCYSLRPIDFPVHVFFKLIQTSLKNPFIKLNGKRKSENMYRLYCNQTSDRGNLVPNVTKKDLIKYGGPLKNTNHLFYYFEERNLIMEIDEVGNIFFKLYELNLKTMEEVETIVKDTSKEIIDKLLEYFDTSNKIFSHFNSLQEKNVEIIEITYNFLYKKEKRLNLNKYMSCFSCILNYIDSNNDITKLMYKRVSDFNVTESMDAFLIDAINKQLTNKDVDYTSEIENLKNNDGEESNDAIKNLIYTFAQNFKSGDIISATEYISRFFENTQLSQEAGKNRIRRVKSNPGFLIEIKTIDSYIEVKVHSINDIKYIHYIELFMTVLIQMSQGLIKDEGKCMKIVKEVTIEEVIKTNIEEIGEEDDFEFEYNDSDAFNFGTKKEMTPEEKDEMTPEEIALNADEEKEKEKDEDIDEMTPEEIDLNADEEKDEMTPEEIDLNADEDVPFIDDLEKFRGGVFSDADSDTILVFIYDNNDPAEMIKKFGKKLRMDEAKLNGYFRAFDDDECSIIEKKDTEVNGYSITLTTQQFQEFFEYNKHTTELKVTILDKAGNSYDGVSYTRKIHSLRHEPGITYLKHVWLTIEYGWKVKHMDEPGIFYVYDKKHELKGKFNNHSFIKKGDEIKVDLDSKNPFLKRMQERQPILFAQEDASEFRYSRACQWTDRRTPVILTKEEKDEIDAIAPGSYEGAFEYSTDPEKPYYYICPRYWDVKSMIPVKAEDVDLSKVISSNDKLIDIKKNIQSRYIFDFANKKGEIHSKIGILSQTKRDDGHSLPCCFKQKVNSGDATKKKEGKVDELIRKASIFYQELKQKHEENKKEKDETPALPSDKKLKITIKPKMVTEVVSEKLADQKKTLKIITKKNIDNILNGDIFPLDEDRSGHLTPILERFFDFKYSQCYIIGQIQKKKLQVKTHCLLRKGVEKSKTQSFLAAISFIMNNNSLSIDEFKQKILSVINIDNIQSFHGGNIVNSFSKDNYDTQDISAYKHSKIYRVFNGNETAFKKIVNGYENFRSYILSNEYIDYTYMWDIICSGLLHKKGQVNMIILHEDMQDRTHNLTIVCPTTTHSSYRFNPNVPSFVLYRYGNYFEPLFSRYERDEAEKKYYEIKMFDLSGKSEIPILTNILKNIDNHISELCREKNVNNKYIFKMNIYLDRLLVELEQLDGYVVEKQVMNYDGRIIGVMVSHVKLNDNNSFFIPCRASQVSGDYELINDNELNNYNTTLVCLEKVYKDSNGKIPCKPKMKMVEDSMMIGILTETNQMVSLNEPEPIKQDGLEEVNEHSYIEYDRYISEHPLKIKKDKAIKNLKLEQSFYIAFFNTIKIKVNEMVNLQLKMRIQEIIKSDIEFILKLNKIKELLQPLIETHTDFITYDSKILDELEDINLCKTKEQPYCNFVSNDGVLLIPSKNLFTKLDNKELYMNRLIDDIISNFYVQEQFFKEIHSTVFYTDKFNLKKNEILLLETYIPSYFDTNSTIVKNIPSLNHRTIEDVTPNDILEVLDKTEVTETFDKDPELVMDKPNEIDEYSSDEEEGSEKRVAPKVETKHKKQMSVISEEPSEEEKDTMVKDTIVKEMKLVKEIQVDVARVKKIISISHIKKNKVNIIEATEKINLAVEKAKTLSDSPEHQELLVETKEIQKEINQIKTNESILEVPKNTEPKRLIIKSGLAHETMADPLWKKCIADVAYLTKSWERYFRKTKNFRIGVGKTYNEIEQDGACNMYLALNLLKDFNPDVYREHKITDFRQMLIKMYDDYIKYRQLILIKWSKEKTIDYTLTHETDMEAIIMNESYNFTEVDLVLMIFYYQLPIVIFHQAKEKLKMLRSDNHTEDYAYYIKMKGKSIFMLYWNNKKTFKIYDSDLIPEHKDDLFEKRMNLREYLRTEDF